MNPLFTHHNPQMQNVTNVYQLLTSPNPMALFNQLATNNPQLQTIANSLNMGANPQSIFNNLCQQKGVDPNQFLKYLKDSIR